MSRYLAHLVAGRPAVAVAETSEDMRVLTAKISKNLVGVYGDASLAMRAAEGESDDRSGLCRIHQRARGRHVCSDCQAATLAPALIASLAVGGSKAPSKGV